MLPRHRVVFEMGIKTHGVDVCIEMRHLPTAVINSLRQKFLKCSVSAFENPYDGETRPCRCVGPGMGTSLMAERHLSSRETSFVNESLSCIPFSAQETTNGEPLLLETHLTMLACI